MSWKDKNGVSWGMEDSIEEVVARHHQAYKSWLRFGYKPYVGPRTDEEWLEKEKFLRTLVKSS